MNTFVHITEQLPNPLDVELHRPLDLRVKDLYTKAQSTSSQAVGKSFSLSTWQAYKRKNINCVYETLLNGFTRNIKDNKTKKYELCL